MTRSRRSRVHLVTQARTPRSQDIGYRERRYLIMMAVRVACFLVAIIMVTRGAGWLAAFPAVGAIVIPYFAVVFANGGREPNDTRGFREYQPSLPERHLSPAGRPGLHMREVVIVPPPAAAPGAAGAPGERTRETGTSGTSDDSGPASHNEPIEPAHPVDPHIRTAWAGEDGKTATPVPPAQSARQARSAAGQTGAEKPAGNG